MRNDQPHQRAFIPEENLSKYFAGVKLYGDDFSQELLDLWYEIEEEGYFNLDGTQNDPSAYKYHEMNLLHTFNRIPGDRFENVLGFGSADGGEFEPISERIEALTIIEPAPQFARKHIFGIPATYIQPEASGKLKLQSEKFDLVVCLSALHHVANVSYVISELARCIKPNGYVVIREPTVSMGDWRFDRPGLTKTERGIPIDIMRSALEAADLKIIEQRRFGFPITPRLARFTKSPVFNSRLITRLDHQMSKVFSFMNTYHPTSTFRKLQPSAGSWLAQKS